jgi:hypothetical protein
LADEISSIIAGDQILHKNTVFCSQGASKSYQQANTFFAPLKLLKTMEKTISTAEFEKTFVAQLADQFDKKQLSAMSRSVASLGNLAQIIDWRWVGQPGFWDLIHVNYQVPIKEFKPENFFGNDRFAEIRVIRKGIPFPRFFEIEATIRNSQRAF